MNTKTIAIVTLSYKADFERCKLLVDSFAYYNQTKARFHHYIIVDRQDRKLFSQFKDDNHTILSVEEIIPFWKIPFFSNGWIHKSNFSLHRNWMVQQIAKLAIANFIEEDFIVHIDSDTVFIDFFDLSVHIDEKQNAVRLYSEPGILDQSNFLARYNRTAESILKMYPQKFPLNNYISNVVFWERLSVLSLHKYIETIWNRDWIEVCLKYQDFSEYALYGTFKEKIYTVGARIERNHLSVDYWKTKKLNSQDLEKFFAEGRKNGAIAAMVSAKSGTNPSDYRYLAIDLDC